MLGTIMPDPVSKDQYKAVLELSQVLWDGGRIKSHREMIESSAGVSGQNVEVNLYHLNERIDQLYFGILQGVSTLVPARWYIQAVRSIFLAIFLLSGCT